MTYGASRTSRQQSTPTGASPLRGSTTRKGKTMTEHGRLEGKRALITGGGRGIGAAIARRLASDGAAVAINYVSDAHSAEALVAELTAAGHRAAAFQAD